MRGPRGQKGDSGVDGTPGAGGETGEDGPDGIPGPQGEAGKDGSDGLPGRNGNPGLPGSRGDKGNKGPAGETGRKGGKGVKGPLGSAGPRGENGQKGPSGKDGEPGGPGQLGLKGFDGPTGEPGDMGDQGDRAAKGDTGYMGFKGGKGRLGQKGSRGLPGYIGEQGDIGLKGNKGILGPEGPAGVPGPMGRVGKKGPNGDQGPKGYAGKDQEQGPAGATGPPGLPGPSMLPPWVGGGMADGSTKGDNEGELPTEGEELPPEELPEINPFYKVFRYYSSAKNEEQLKTMAPEEAVTELGKKNSEFSDKLEKVKVNIKDVQRPDGSRENPGRTCRDINLYYPEKISGMFWIDPNGGCLSDAIMVHCNFTDMGDSITCIKPDTHGQAMSVERAAWSKKLTHARKWLSEDHDLANIDYQASASQLKYLSHLSREAYQTVTIHCKDQVVWYDSSKGNYEKAMHFMGSNQMVYTPIIKKRISTQVIQDGCKSQSKDWSSTVLRFVSRKFVHLPIVDVAPVRSERDARFGIELGPVCFL